MSLFNFSAWGDAYRNYKTARAESETAPRGLPSSLERLKEAKKKHEEYTTSTISRLRREVQAANQRADDLRDQRDQHQAEYPNGCAAAKRAGSNTCAAGHFYVPGPVPCQACENGRAPTESCDACGTPVWGHRDGKPCEPPASTVASAL